MPEKTWLVWGIKASFMRYVSRLPGSEASVGGGAGFTPSKEFAFPLIGEQSTGVQLAFAGDLHILAHGGMMNFTIAQPIIEFQGDGGATLSAAMSKGDERHTQIARLETLTEQPDGETIIATYRAILLEAAVHYFNDVYQSGTELDQVRLVAPVQ